jgi:hypothetical protein
MNEYDFENPDKLSPFEVKQLRAEIASLKAALKTAGRMFNDHGPYDSEEDALERLGLSPELAASIAALREF